MIFKKYQGQAQAPEVPFSLCSWVNSSVSKGLTITQFYQIPKKQSVYLHSTPELKIQYPCPTAGLMDRHTSTPKETPKNPPFLHLHFLQHSSAFRKWSTVTGLCLTPLIPSTAIKLDDLHRNGFSFASELSRFTSVTFSNYFATTFRLISWYYFCIQTPRKMDLNKEVVSHSWGCHKHHKMLRIRNPECATRLNVLGSLQL